MTDAARAARNAYKRRWAAENPEKVKAYQSKYWERKAAEQERGKPSEGDHKTHSGT